MIKIAYIILAHTDPLQLKNEVEALLESGDVFIHINKLNDESQFKKTIGTLGCKRVYFTEQRVAVRWAGFSILQATFNTLRMCLAVKEYDRVVLLTGQEFPIKSSREIIDFFEEHKNVEFVKSQPISGKDYPSSYKMVFRDNRLYMAIYTRLEKLVPAKYLRWKKDYVTYKGKRYSLYAISPKWALTGMTAKKVCDFFFNAKEVTRYYKSKHAGDDTYVATVLRILGIEESTISKFNLFYEKKLFGQGISCKTLDITDLQDIIGTDEFFARKFGSQTSNGLVDCLFKMWKDNDRFIR